MTGGDQHRPHGPTVRRMVTATDRQTGEAMLDTLTITVTHEYDHDSNPLPENNRGSIWDIDDEVCNPTEENRREIRDRIEAWKRDEWWYVGVVVTVQRTVVYTAPDGTDRIATDEDEASLWGIESDSGDDYFIEVAQECLYEALNEIGSTLGRAEFTSAAIIDKPEGTWTVAE